MGMGTIDTNTTAYHFYQLKAGCSLQDHRTAPAGVAARVPCPHLAVPADGEHHAERGGPRVNLPVRGLPILYHPLVQHDQ